MADSHDLVRPARRTNIKTSAKFDGTQNQMLTKMLGTGDPLADAVIAELRTGGQPSRDMLNRGIRQGLASLKDETVPPSTEAFLQEAETVPSWLEPDCLTERTETFLATSGFWFGLVVAASLVHTYSSPAIARLLMHTGKLNTEVPQRLKEVGLWFNGVMLPGGLTRGGPGYIGTLQVRLLHARIRSGSLAHGWNAQDWGVPINQVDQARTWLNFAYVPFFALRKMGFEFTDGEIEHHWKIWRYVAHLLGVDPEFHSMVRNDADAQKLLDLVDSTNEAPDDNSRALTAALIDSTAARIKLAPLRAAVRGLLNSVVRKVHGKELANALAVPRSLMACVVPLLVRQNKRRCRKLRETPALREAIIESTIESCRKGIASRAPKQDPTAFKKEQAGGSSSS